MAITSIGSVKQQASTSNNQSSFAVTTVTASAGDFLVLCVACDNSATVDGDEGAVSGVTDTSGNTWTKAQAFTNSQGASQAGATVEVWYSILASALAAGTITISLTNNTHRDAVVAAVWEFNLSNGTGIALEGTPSTEAADGADAGAIDVTTINTECLRLRAIAIEVNDNNSMSETVGWTDWGSSNSLTADDGGATTSMQLRVEHLISVATGAVSNPTLGDTNRDNASVYVAFREPPVAKSASDSATLSEDATGIALVPQGDSGTLTEVADLDTGEAVAVSRIAMMV